MMNDEKLEIIEIIADILEEDIENIKEENELADYENWDSVAVLSVISVVGERTGRFLHASEIGNLVTIKDLMEVLKNG